MAVGKNRPNQIIVRSRGYVTTALDLPGNKVGFEVK